jgi:hypothetical protein
MNRLFGCSRCIVCRCGVFGEGGTRALAELLYEFEGKRTTGALVAVNCRGHEDEVWAHEIAD